MVSAALLSVAHPARGNLETLAGWRSLGKRRTNVTWSHDDVMVLAAQWRDNIPEHGKALIEAGALLQERTLIQKGDFAPTRQDVKSNYLWIKTVVSLYPSRIPSSYFIADALLELDGLFDSKLIKGSKAQKAEQALTDAATLREIISHSRRMYRASSSSSYDEEVMEIKALMTPRQSEGSTAGAGADQQAIKTAENPKTIASAKLIWPTGLGRV